MTLWKEVWISLKKNKGAMGGLLIVSFFLLLAIFANLVSPYDPIELFDEAQLKTAFWLEGHDSRFLLGTDDVGRDLLSRLIFGARVSLAVGFLVVIMSLTIGTFFGIIAGYFGGWIDSVTMRLVDILMSLPSILLAIVVVSILGPSLWNAIIAVSIVAIPNFLKIARASVLGEKVKPYVIASKTFGASHLHILFINILPNCFAPLIVQATLGFGSGILNAAALGFLGLGAQPPIAEWGTMLADSRSYLESNPWLVTMPGLCILFVVLGFNLLGDGLRDALDPKLKK